MDKKIYLLCLFLLWVMLGCSVIFNPLGDIIVKQNGQIIANKAGQYDFGEQNAGFSSDAIEFRIQNISSKINYLTAIPAIQVSGTNASNFYVDTNSTNNVIEAGLFTIFTITFNPTSVGMKSATVTIANSCKTQNPYTFTVLELVPQ